jgi:RNA polymerase sigma factor (sigma-70 family)
MMQPVGLSRDDRERSEADDFRSFFDAEYERLARALFLLTGDATEADELAQEAMVRMFERWDRVRGMDSPTGYLYRTAMNLHRSAIRRMVTRGRRSVGGAPAVDPADAVEARDLLGRALASLPDGQREALVLVEWLGMEPDEAGRVLGIEAGSVRSRLSRARAAVRARLAAEDDDA